MINLEDKFDKFEQDEGFQNPEDRAFMLSKIRSVFGSADAPAKNLSHKSRETRKTEIPDDILQRPISDLMDNEKIAKLFQSTGVTIRELLNTSQPENIPALKKLGAIAELELNRRLKKFKMLAENFFDDEAPDINLIKKLESLYGLKRVRLAELLGTSEASLSIKLKKVINRGRWRGKILDEDDEQVFAKMHNENHSQEISHEKKYMILKGDNPENQALLVMSDGKVNCWLSVDMPEELRRLLLENPEPEIIDSEPEPDIPVDEIMTANATGNIISILKEKFFCPDDYQGFANLAEKRGMTIEDYSEFIFGLKLKRWNSQMITDTKIIDLFEKRKNKNGKIPAAVSRENWIYQFAKRKGFDKFGDFVKFYGYEPE